MVRKTKAGTFEVDIRTQPCNCDKIQGAHRHRVQKTFDTKREADEYEKEALAQVVRREFVKPSTATVCPHLGLGSDQAKLP